MKKKTLLSARIQNTRQTKFTINPPRAPPLLSPNPPRAPPLLSPNPSRASPPSLRAWWRRSSPERAAVLLSRARCARPSSPGAAAPCPLPLPALPRRIQRPSFPGGVAVRIRRPPLPSFPGSVAARIRRGCSFPPSPVAWHHRYTIFKSPIKSCGIIS